MRAFPVLASVALASSAAASPPPPPPAFIGELASRLIPTPTAEGFDRYSDLVADDLKVTINGNTISRNKSEWLALERSRLGKVDRPVFGHAEGRDNLLILDRFDDKSDEHCPPGGLCVFDPRFHVRASRYQIGADHRVHSIQIVESEGLLQVP